MRSSNASISAGFLAGARTHWNRREAAASAAVAGTSDRGMKSLYMAFGILALAATSAKATVTTVTVSGNIKDGMVCRAWNVSQPAGCTDLAGQAYSMIYTVDDSLGTRISDAHADYLFGGTSHSLNPPTPVTAQAYIAGEIFTSPGTYNGYAATISPLYNGTTSDLQLYQTRDQDMVVAPGGQVTHLYQTEFTSEIYYTASPASPRLFDPISGLSSLSFGQIFYRNHDISGGVTTNYLYLLAHTDIQNVVFNAGSGPGTGALPEPASWTLMIAGIGLVGAALRRRRASTVSPATV